jgi:hypothetical protein
MEQLQFNFERRKSIYEEKSEFFSKLIYLAKNIKLLEEAGSLSFERTVLKYNLYKLLNESLKDVLFSLTLLSDFNKGTFFNVNYFFALNFNFSKEILSVLYEFISVSVPLKFRNSSFVNSNFKLQKEKFENISFGLDENFETIYDNLINFDFETLEKEIIDNIGKKLFDEHYSYNIDLSVLIALSGSNDLDKESESIETLQTVSEIKDLKDFLVSIGLEYSAYEKIKEKQDVISDENLSKEDRAFHRAQLNKVEKEVISKFNPIFGEFPIEMLERVIGKYKKTTQEITNKESIDVQNENNILTEKYNKINNLETKISEIYAELINLKNSL